MRLYWSSDPSARAPGKTRSSATMTENHFMSYRVTHPRRGWQCFLRPRRGGDLNSIAGMGRMAAVSIQRTTNTSICTALTDATKAVSYTHLRAHETDSYLVCRLLLEKK